MNDLVFTNWLRAQSREAADLSKLSDRLDVAPADGALPGAYVATFDCRGLIRDERGEVRQHQGFHVWIQFGTDHLRRVDPLRLAICQEPLWHPNALPTPFGSIICPGAARPGVGLTVLLEQYYGVLTWQKVNRADPLNPAASEWARAWDGKPIDGRPFRRQSLQMRLRPAPAAGRED